MIEQIPSTLQSSDCTFSTITDSSTNSTFSSLFCQSSPRDYFFSSWELFWSTQVELFTSRTKSPPQLAISWVENLASKISCLEAEISQLRLKAQPSLEQQRAMLVYSAAVKYSKKAESMHHATTNTPFLTISHFGCLRTFGASATWKFCHQREPAITVAGPTGLWMGGLATSDYCWQWL